MQALDLVRGVQNIDGSPKANRDFGKISWTRSVASANYDNVFSEELATIVKANSLDVLVEIETLRELRLNDPLRHAITSFVFAILSPQTNFAENVLACRNIMDNWYSLYTAADILECLYVPWRGKGEVRLINLGLGKAKYLHAALKWIDDIFDVREEFTFENIRKIKGMGDKTIRMALALYDDENKVFTLDQWMLRLTYALHEGNPRATFIPTTAGYALTEGAWLAFCHEYFTDYSPFAVQWTLWNLCFGSHVSHLPIFGL